MKLALSIVVALMVCGVASATPPCEQPANLAWGSPAANADFSISFADTRAAGQVFALDGNSGKELPLPADPGAGLRVQWTSEPVGMWTQIAVTVANNRADLAKLELGLRLLVPAGMDQFFDGDRASDPSTAQRNERLEGRFPVTALSSPTACVALGHAPDQWLSYLRHMSTPGDAGTVLETATRIVVDPGQAETLRFLVGGFPTSWRHREAIHWYYAAFPEFFVPRQDVDPRASLNGGSYLVWSEKPDAELCRRLQVGWDWCYAPFKRTGDIFGRPEFWDYEPARPHDPSRTVTLDEYHANRQKRFEAGKQCDVAMMCYIPSQIWCEEQLAREHYADALITDSRVTTYFDKPWCTGPDNELRVFPLNTSFGRQSLTDMEALVAENNMQGFAFDTANGGGRYYGPAAGTCPGRAWDDKGVYVDEGVAIAKLMDWCHEHKSQSGQTLAVVSNPGPYGVYLTPMRSDSAMIEASPESVHSGSAEALRVMLGHKTMVIWENYELEELLDFEKMTAAQMTEALDGLADYTIIASLRMAAIPTPRVTLGMRKLAKWLPLLTEIARAGWQPVAAASCDKDLPVSRAGSGLRQFITTGNETAAAVAGTISADNAWLGGGATLLRAEGLDRTEQDVAGGATRVNFALPPRKALVLRSALNLSPAPEGLKATVSVQQDLHLARLGIALQSPNASESIISVPDWGPWNLDRLTLDGTDLEFEPAPEGWRTRAPAALAGKQQLTVALSSRFFRTSGRQLGEFTFLKDGKPAFEVRVPANAAPEIALAARQVADYFPYYLAHAAKPPLEVPPVPVVTTPTAGTPGILTLNVDPASPRQYTIATAGKGQEVRITGRTPADVKRAVAELLAALDLRYPYGGGFAGTVAIRAVDLVGAELDTP